jgi:hypothetical protein
MAAFKHDRFSLILGLVLPGLWCVGMCDRAGAAVVNFFETEPNNSLLTANPVPFFFTSEFPFQSWVNIGGALSPGDVDYFQFTFTFSVIFEAFAADGTPAINDNDSVLGLFNNAGELLHFNDDASPGFTMSTLLPVALEAGTYYLAISGGGDNGFIGNHQEDFAYGIQIALFAVPAPGALPLLGAAIALGPARRRRLHPLLLRPQRQRRRGRPGPGHPPGQLDHLTPL